jgi:prephenate dehydrogenase
MSINITIIGLDLLGASLGLALGALAPAQLPTGRPIITGWDRDQRTLKDVRGRLMIDRAASDVAESVQDADVVFVSGSLAELDDTFRAIAPHLKQGAVVSDMASVKTQVLELAREYLPETVDFIGGHPLASTSGRGLQDASIDFFNGVIYCLVAEIQARPGALDTVEKLVTAIGAKPYYIDAAEHDAYIAGVEHLPIIVSAALMEALSSSGGWREMQPITGERFRTATRLAATKPETSRDICLANAVAIERWINTLIQTLLHLRDNLQNGDQLEAMFQHAQEAHDQWLAARPNMRPGEDDLVKPMEQVDRSLGALLFGRRKPRSDRKDR